MSSRKKLTLSVDERIIERARCCSRRHDIQYLSARLELTSRLSRRPSLMSRPPVRRLVGILPADTSVHEYQKHVEKKYATLQMPCATTAAADDLVTRNPRDFDSDSIAVVTSAELLVTLRSWGQDILDVSCAPKSKAAGCGGGTANRARPAGHPQGFAPPAALWLPAWVTSIFEAVPSTG